jgi:regulator of sigma E protease
VQVSKKWQATILAAGVVFNILFAWFLFSLGFMVGLPTSVDNELGIEVKNPALTITMIVDNSPAKEVGLKAGDKIKEISLANGDKVENLVPENVSDFINKSSGQIMMKIDRGEEILDFNILPDAKIVEGKKVIGINMDNVGTLSLPIHKAIWEGGKTTINIMEMTVFGIGNLIKDAVKGDADMTNIAGPVGIIGLVGDASRLGFVYLITFTALISINLAIINLVPFPALDGGRILFVIIEGIIRRPINPKFAQITNTVGFALLIALMLFITYRDILRLF